MAVDMKPIDFQTYQTRIQDFLPPRLIDVHTHIWRKSFTTLAQSPGQGQPWADRIAPENDVAGILRDYRQMLPQQEVTPLLFGYPSRNIDPQVNNRWVQEESAKFGCPSLYLSTPGMAPGVLEAEVNQGGFRGLKPYPDFSPPDLSPDEITIFDFLPWSHLEVADANRWIVMLHIPRAGRLGDPLNLAQMLKIDHHFKHLRLVIAHVGRAYCPEDIGAALDVIRQTQHLYFDLSANTCPEAMQAVLQAVGSKRVLFGSDLPITTMRMRRVCESGQYINLVPAGLYGNVSADPHMREAGEPEAQNLTLFLYEEILALRSAAEALNLASTDIEDIFFNNARHLLFGNP